MICLFRSAHIRIIHIIMTSKMKHSGFFYFFYNSKKYNMLNNSVLYKQYKTISFDYRKDRNKDSIHSDPGATVWKNSSYSYNKNMMDLPFHQKYTNKIIKNYFDLNAVSLDTKYLFLDNSLKPLKPYTKNYIGSPIIKDNNNNSTVTLYIYSREKRFIVNELFFIKRSFYRHIKPYNIRFRKIIEEKSILLQKSYNRYLLETFIKDAKKISLFFVKKKLIFKTLFFYSFLKWALSRLDIKLLIYKSKEERKHKNKTVSNYIKKIKIKRGRYFDIYVFRKPRIINIKTINYINIILIKHLKDFSSKENNIKLLYYCFKNRYFYTFKETYFEDEFLALKYLSMLRLYINKFDSYIPILKMFLKKILNKKVIINIVDLKYFYMNSDFFSKTASLFLKYKDPTLYSVRKVNRLVRVFKINNNNFINSYKNIYTKKVDLNSDVNKMYKDFLYKTVQNMFRQNFKNNLNRAERLKSILNKPWDTNINYVLNFLKHKWISGIRLEAKGRLSKKFGATRSKYLFAYKGNLRIMQPITDPDFKRDDDKLHPLPGVVLVRNEFSSNLQSSQISSKKLTGAFGIKGWISSN